MTEIESEQTETRKKQIKENLNLTSPEYCKETSILEKS